MNPPDAPVVPIAATNLVVLPEYLDIEQAAQYLSATVTSARRWLKNQQLRCVKIGKRFTYRRIDIDNACARKAA